MRRPTAEKTPASYLFVVCLVVALVCAAFVFHLQVRFEGVRLGYLTSQARVQRARMLVERRELRLELASLKAPKHVESEAREKLDMEMPDYRRIVTIGSKRKAVLASGRAR
jgi:cell division protein FtsL